MLLEHVLGEKILDLGCSRLKIEGSSPVYGHVLEHITIFYDFMEKF